MRLRCVKLIKLLSLLLIFSCSNMLGDIEAPTVGGSGVIKVVDTLDESGGEDFVTVSWFPASDESHSSENITYTVYFTEEDPNGDIGTVNSTGEIITILSSGETSFTIPKVEDGQVGYITVVATDPIGNSSIYITRPFSSDRDITNVIDDNGELIPRDNVIIMDEGSLGVEVIIIRPEEATFKFTYGSSIEYKAGEEPVVNKSETLSIHIIDCDDPNPQWILISSEASESIQNSDLKNSNKTFDFNATDRGLNIGVYSLLVTVEIDNKTYSKSFRFKVINDEEINI